MIGLTADVDIEDSVDLLGKSIADLQSGVTVNNASKTITGVVNYVEDYTGFSGDPAEQSGNYLALHFGTVADDTTITVELIGGVHGPVTLDPDGICIFRLTNTLNQTIAVTASKDGQTSDTATYTLRGLSLAKG